MPGPIKEASVRLDHLITTLTREDAPQADKDLAGKEIAGAFQRLHAAFEGAIDDLDRRVGDLEAARYIS
jgi:hypothetical protein